MKKRAAVAAILIVLAGVLWAGKKPEASEAIRQADLDFNQAAADRNLDHFMALVADDARFVSQGQVLEGKEAVRQEWSKLFLDLNTTLSWAPDFAEVSKSGDLGFTQGSYQITGKGPEGPWSARGKYLTVWRKGADGKWRAIADIGSPEPSGKKE